MKNALYKLTLTIVSLALVILLTSTFAFAVISNTVVTDTPGQSPIEYPSVSRENHIFAGWKNIDTGEYFNDRLQPEYDLSLQAQWVYAPLTYAMDRSPVLKDLQSASNLNLSNYPANEDGDMQIIQLVEWAYSSLPQEVDNFAIYIYIYNPQRLQVDVDSLSNKIEMASAYGDTGPTDYDKYSLQITSVSSDFRFIKARVLDQTFNGNTIESRVLASPSARRYDVSGFELYVAGDSNPTEAIVGGTYIYTGYAVGMNNNTTSSLACSVTDLETVKLDVKSTFYRPETAGRDLYSRNQLDSVYFGVPNEILTAYGKLQKIKAEWYEYNTNGIVVTDSQGLYDKLFGDVGSQEPTYRAELGIGGEISYWSTINSDLTAYSQDVLTTLFLVDNIDIPITSEDLEEYLLNYDKSNRHGNLPVNGGNISADPFYTVMDDSVIVSPGYQCLDIDAGDEYDFNNLGDNLSSFGNFWLWLCGYTVTDDLNNDNIQAIVPVTSLDITLPAETIANTYKIDVADVPAFIDSYEQNLADNKTTYLFRFSQSNYTAGDCQVYKIGGLRQNIYDDCYVAMQTVYLNFDIIQLTFARAGTYKVIPVVANPINIIAYVTPPIEPGPPTLPDFDFWNWLKSLFTDKPWLWAVVGGVALVLFALIFTGGRSRTRTVYVNKYQRNGRQITSYKRRRR